jgi:hypothetical protein
LTGAEAADLLGTQIDAEGGYVLLRGLCGGGGTGKFDVYGREGSGDHRPRIACLAKRGGEAVAVVVKLSDVPRDVYVQYGIAE